MLGQRLKVTARDTSTKLTPPEKKSVETPYLDRLILPESSDSAILVANAESVNY